MKTRPECHRDWCKRFSVKNRKTLGGLVLLTIRTIMSDLNSGNISSNAMSEQTPMGRAMLGNSVFVLRAHYFLMG